MAKFKILTAALAVLLAGCAQNAPVQQEQPEEEKVIIEKDREVSFLAAGDNLIHGLIYYSGDQGDGSYSFDRMYERVSDEISSADIAYLNQETICGGTQLGLQSYPTFNSPYEILDSVAAAGFDWISTSSNHSMDVGEEGILSQLSHLEELPQLIQTGTNASADEAKEYKVIEKNGVKIGLLSYTYGLNGFALPDGKEYLVNLIDEDRIREDMKELNQISDVQVVSMHWGVEYQFEENEEQRALAQLLSDEGADVIIGTHPHVLQPMEVLKGEEGNETLVMYSLGNFVSAQDVNSRMLGGMAKWTLVYHPSDKSVSFKNICFEPTVMYFDPSGTDVQVYPLSEYTDDTGASHYLSAYGQDMSKQYFIDLVREIMGNTVELVY
ncbi:MAG: CapA family protein [Merdibacter sp.]|nr:CapA family protein [Merdibacter sp.]